MPASLPSREPGAPLLSENLLVWGGLLYAAGALAVRPGGLWATKATLVILIGTAFVFADPLHAATAIALASFLVLGLPAVLAHIALRLFVSRRFSASILFYRVLVLLHPD